MNAFFRYIVRHWIPVILTMFCLTGCFTAKPLSFHHYRKNIVIGKDNRIRVEQEPIDFTNLRHELVKRMIYEKTPITLHFYQDVPAEIFDTVVDKLKAEGFRNLKFKIYGD